jgi:hypothetical protein
MNTARNLSMANTLPFLSPVAAIGIGMTLAFLPVSLRAQDQAVTGNLTVNGNVGVGTTAPAQKLTISSGSSTRTQLLMSDGNTASLMLAAGNSLPGTIASDLSLQFRTGVIYPNADGNGVTALTIDSAGKVGIGTTTPTTLLQLSATNTLAPIISLNTNNTNTANGAIKWTNQAGTAQAAIGNNFNKGDGNGNLEFMTGGVATTRMIIDSSGNVGIGTIAPSYNLTVAAAVKVFSTGVSSFILGKDGSTGTDYGKLTYDDSTGVLSLINPRTYPLTFQTNATERMRIDAAGNVGIGTTNPDASLKIQKTGDDNGLANILINLSLSKADDTTGLIFGYRTDETTGIIAPRTATGNLAFYNYNGAWAETMRLTNIGNVGIGTSTPATKLEVAGTEANNGSLLRLTNSTPSTGKSFDFVSDNGGNLNLYDRTSTVSRLFVESGGSIGVGTTQPSAKLDVAGDAHVSGNLTINGTLNAANYSVGNGATAFPNTVSVGTTTSTGVLTVRTNSASPVLFLENNLDAGRNMSISPYISGVANGGFQIRDETAGASRLVINGNGEVGIGTTSPHGGLHIKKDFGPGFLTADTLRLDSGVLEHQAVLHLTDGVTSDGHIYFTPSATAPSRWVGLTARATDGDFIVNGNGNVGIGTTSLTDKLTVQGGSTQLYPHFGDTNSRGFPYALNIVGTDGSAAGNLMFSARNINDVSMNAVGLFEFAPNTGDLVYYSRSAAGNLVASDARLTIQSGGNVGIGSPSPMAKLDITADATYDIPQVIIKGAANNNRQLFFGYDTSNNFGFIQPIDQGIAYRNFIVNPHGGNVGIGTTTPSARLDVAGDAHISGDLTINGTLNAANYSVGNGATAFPNTVSVGTITSSGVLTVRTNSASPVLFLENNLDTGRNMSISPYISGVANGGFQIRDETAGASRLVINSDGNVGIGNTSPDAKLSITKDTTTITDENAYALKITDGNADTGLLAGVNATGHYSIIQSLDPSTGWTTRPLSLMPNGGNVGIGTTMPFFALTVGDQAGIGALTDTAGDLIGKTGLVFHNALGNYPAAAIANLQSNNYGGTLLFGTKGNGGGALTERMRIDYLGNVGIGTTTPGSYKLAVNGTIHAKDLVVDQSGWADYVLDPAYRNAPLSEVEQQIKEQGHLPGVPSAKDVAEKGVSVAQMQAVLLSKVEELTLHLIAQEKLLKEQSARISQLEAENASIRSR